jgi:hypothetical protein
MEHHNIVMMNRIFGMWGGGGEGRGYGRKKRPYVMKCQKKISWKNEEEK